MENTFYRAVVAMLVLGLLSGRIFFVLICAKLLVFRYLYVSLKNDRIRRRQEKMFNDYLEDSGRLN